MKPALVNRSEALTEYDNPLHLSKSLAALFAPSPLLHVHDRIIAGLPFSFVREIATPLGLEALEMAARCGLSRSTYLRKVKKPKERLSNLESDALTRHINLLRKACEAFGDFKSARTWLKTAQPGLGNAIPIELARTSVGAREVEKLLTRIEHGVYA